MGPMDIFQRNIHLNAKKIDDDHMQVESSLLDLEHSFNLEITVRVSNHTIEKVTASITKAPFTHCLAALDNFTRSLEGLSIERGIVKQIHSRLGGPKGCAHLLELLNDTVRFTSMLLLGQSMGYRPELREALTEEEIIADGRKKLRNTCLVFADQQEET